jgi:hypothetical protein
VGVQLALAGFDELAGRVLIATAGAAQKHPVIAAGNPALL